jgi:hypothetical protein
MVDITIFYSYLQMTLPCDDVKGRADAAQRPNYKVTNKLPSHLEYELSRLFEKYIFLDLIYSFREIHYHLKVEQEKKTLER